MTISLLLIFISASLFALSPERILFNEAENRYRSGDLDFALSRYQDLLKEYPLSEYVPDAKFRIAVINLRTGKVEEADALFNRIETRYMNTHFIDYLPFWKGLIKFKQKNWEQSSSLFTVFMDKKPSSLIKEATLYRARAEYNLGRTKSALSVLDAWFKTASDIHSDPYLFTFYLTLLEKDGQYKSILDLTGGLSSNLFQEQWMDRIYLIRGEGLYKLGKIPEAEIYYQKILTAGPDISSIGFIRLFSIYKNDTSRQTAIFDKAQVALSGHPDMLNKFLLRVGIDSFKNGQLELASSYLWRIWRTGDISSINNLVPVYLAKILASEGEKSKASEILTEYNNKVKPANELVLYTLSNILVEEGQWAAAESILKTFLFTFPESEYYSNAAWMYAYSLYKSGQFSESKSVIDSVLADGKGGASTTDFILLSARVYIKLGNFPNALSMFKEYLPFDNKNSEIWYNIIKLQFNQGNYSDVSDSYKKVQAASLLDKDGPYILLIRYIAGLGDIADKLYKGGLEKLSYISDEALKKRGLDSIEPYVRYYRGWASYKLADYDGAFEWFKLVVEDYPESSVYSEALYFAGWSVYLKGEYSQAAKYFADYSNTASSADRAKGLFFYGKSLISDYKLSEGEVVFQKIFSQYPNNPYADDAMFEYGKLLEEQGENKLAISMFRELYKRYKTSPLAEESLFRIGEIYISLKDYDNAIKSFYYHRLKFPKGSLGDASFYWGAEAAGKNGEPYAAILLLEKLLSEYAHSSFKPNALQKIAALYADEGEYRKAISFYGDFLTNYSESASAPDVRSQIKKLNLLQSGSDEKEAELLVLIGDKGTKTEKSREAYIELAKMYLYKFNGREKEAYDLLTKIGSLKDRFPASAAKASYYLGDYYSIKKDYVNAVKSFVEAATLYPANTDLTGVSLLRAAEMAISAGDMLTAKKMVNLLEINFPSSSWLEEGKRILEKNR